MPVTFSITPGISSQTGAKIEIGHGVNSVVVSALDTTPATSAVNDWKWYYNNTLVSTTDRWVNTFFAPVSAPLRLVVTGVNFTDSAETISSIDVFTPPSGISFNIHPASAFSFIPPSANVVFSDDSYSVCAVSAWDWYINGALASNLSSWSYTFFSPITTTVQMTTSGSSAGIQTIGPRNLIINTQDPVLPSIFAPGRDGSTTLNSTITSYDRLIDRIEYQLGAPLVNVEITCDQVYDFINQGIEWFTKYAGQTEEYLVFDSNLYSPYGIRLDALFSITTELNTLQRGVSSVYDYDLADYRKVVDVFTVEVGESTGINTLFTLEHAMAQQTYFSYQLGNAGFDLVTWEVLKQWLDLRSKLLAQKIYFRFDGDSQLLRLIPAPTPTAGFLGIVGCYVEKSIRTLLKERWIQRYALALTKIAVGHVRGKFTNVSLFGGGSITPGDIMQQGIQERAELEEEIMFKHGEVKPIDWYLG